MDRRGSVWTGRAVGFGSWGYSSGFMRMKIWFFLALVGVTLVSLEWSRSAPLQNTAAPADGVRSFKVTFGDLQEAALDYSGSVSLSSGKVVRVAPWRFVRDDAVS